MKIKLSGLILAGLLLIPPNSLLAGTETPSRQEYTYMRFRWTGTEVFSSVPGMLGNVGYTEKNEVKATGWESQILGQVATAGSNYGGLLIIEGHGQLDANARYYLAAEIHPHTTSGRNNAENRAEFLMSGVYYSSGDLEVIYVGDANGWGVCLTEQGISATFSGSNGLVVLASCHGASAFGRFGGTRGTISWEGVIYDNPAQTQTNILFGGLTGEDGPDYMTTATAINGTMQFSGKNMALVPFVSSVDAPDYSLSDTLNTITWNFGTKMKQDGSPAVGGVAVRRGYTWEDDYTLSCNFYCGWQEGKVIVGLNARYFQSSKGIYLQEDDSHEFWCTLAGYPEAASVSLFAPYLSSGGVKIPVELKMWRGTECFWICREDGQLVGDTLWADELENRFFEVFDWAGNKDNRYTLFERERGGNVFIRAEEGVFPDKPEIVAFPKIDYDPEALARELEEKAFTGVHGTVESYLGLIIVPDEWVSSAQVLADYHTSSGRPTLVTPLSVTGSTREEIRVYLEGFYAQGGRYVLLGAGTHDEKFDDESWWPEIPGEDDWRWWYHYYHEHFSSQPERNIIPTWYYPDPEYDNMSYWTPYYSSDFGYTEGLPALRLGRFPAYSLSEFQVLAAKTIHYLDYSGSLSCADKVSLWAFCHNSDGNSGHTVSVLADEISELIPSSFVQNKLYDFTLAYSEREALALADWSAGRAYVFMFSTSSTRYRVIRFFDKSLGWEIGKLEANQLFPVVIASSCGIGALDMFLHPTLGTAIGQDLLTADPNRGACVMIAPSRGTWIQGNQELRRALARYLLEEPTMNLGTAFMLAREEVMAGDQSELARSYLFYGDPMTPLPGQSAITDAGKPTPRFLSRLSQNYPNPFNPVTVIEYSLEAETQVSLRVYNVTGQLVCSLVDGGKTAGLHRVVWDGRDDRGREVASGVYFYRLQTESHQESRKMILLR